MKIAVPPVAPISGVKAVPKNKPSRLLSLPSVNNSYAPATEAFLESDKTPFHFDKNVSSTSNYSHQTQPNVNIDRPNRVARTQSLNDFYYDESKYENPTNYHRFTNNDKKVSILETQLSPNVHLRNQSNLSFASVNRGNLLNILYQISFSKLKFFYIKKIQVF